MTYDRSGSAKLTLTEREIVELVLVICDEHLLEDEGLFSSEYLTHDISDTNCTQWFVAYRRSVVPGVHRFTKWSQGVRTKRLYPTWRFHGLLF